MLDTLDYDEYIILLIVGKYNKNYFTSENIIHDFMQELSEYGVLTNFNSNKILKAIDKLTKLGIIEKKYKLTNKGKNLYNSIK